MEESIARLRQLAGVLEEGTRDRDREDLSAHAARVRERLEGPALTVMAVGEFKTGKSSLVNALLNLDVCPVDDDIATSVPTRLVHGESLVAAALWQGEDDDEPRREIMSLDQARELVVDPRDVESELVSIEVEVPRKLLSTGISIIDTPGVGGMGSAHASATVAALPLADVLLFVSDASQEYTGPELDFLELAMQLCPNVIGVITKVDLYPEWRRIVAADEAHLAARGLEIPTLPVSTALRELAVAQRDEEMDVESGFVALTREVAVEELSRQRARLVATASAELDTVLDQLEQPYLVERETLTDPEAGAKRREELQQVISEAEALRSGAARWQITLGDGIADLGSDLDHELRERFRDLSRRVEQAIDDGDPKTMWERFEPWLYEAVAHEVNQTYLVFHQRTAELTERVAALFAADGGVIRQALPAIDAPATAVTDFAVDASVEVKTASLFDTAVTTLRGGYGGVFLLGMVGTAASVTFAAPVMMGAAAVMGRKTLKQDQERQSAQRRQQAKQAARKYMDEVQFKVGKHNRDALKRVQRSHRDYFQELAEQVQRSTSEAMNQASNAAKMEEAETAKRLQFVGSELEIISNVRQRLAAAVAS